MISAAAAHTFRFSNRFRLSLSLSLSLSIYLSIYLSLSIALPISIYHQAWNYRLSHRLIRLFCLFLCWRYIESIRILWPILFVHALAASVGRPPFGLNSPNFTTNRYYTSIAPLYSLPVSPDANTFPIATISLLRFTILFFLYLS